MTATLVSKILAKLKWGFALNGYTTEAWILPSSFFLFKSATSRDIKETLRPEQIAENKTKIRTIIMVWYMCLGKLLYDKKNNSTTDYGIILVGDEGFEPPTPSV